MSAHPGAISTAVTPVQPRREGSRADLVRSDLLERLASESPFWEGERALRAVEDNPRAVRTDASHATNPHYGLGLLLAPAYAAFSRHVLEHADRFDRVYFLSREGWMFMRMYHRIARALGVRSSKPRGTYLAVNRRLSFLASMEGFSLDEIGRMWRQYPDQSLRQLLKNLSLPEDPFLHLAGRHGLTDPDERIRKPRLHGRFCAFLEDPHVQRLFVLHRDELRGSLSDYLRQRGFFTGGRVALVDVGWKGSIQSNLHRAVRDQRGAPDAHGFYFGLRHAPALDAEGSTRHGFFCDTRTWDWVQSCVLRNNSVFEMFATAPHGSVTGYERDGRGWVHARVHAEQAESDNFRGRFREVWRGIEDWFTDYLDTPEALAASAPTLRPAVLDRLRRYILYPTRAEAKAFLDYSHVENFGVFEVSRYGFKGSRRGMLLGGPLWRLPNRVIHELRMQRWPEGVCARSRVPLANFLFDMADTRKYTR